MKITRMSLALVGALIAPIVVAGPAQAAPPQAESGSFTLEGTDTAPDDGYCPFTVEVDYVTNQNFTETTNPDGSTTQRFSGYATATVTNTESGKSITYKVSGPGTVIIDEDGSFSGDVQGQNLLWTTAANSFKGVPPLAYSTGRVRYVVDENGLTTGYTLNGRRIDVCAALSS
jgi:hypothetical protein